jgi:hypothetical protein
MTTAHTTNKNGRECPAIAEHAKAEKPRPRVEISLGSNRPTIGTLGDVLKETANLKPMGCTRITGYSAEYWRGLGPGESDSLELVIEGSTACLHNRSSVTVYIAGGTSPDIARALLKSIAKEIKSYDNFERFTPMVPTSDDFPF